MDGDECALRLEHVSATEVRPLRNEVLRPGQPLSSTHFDGDDHPLAAHVAIRLGETEIVSVGSVFPDSPPWEPESEGAWRIRGMATKDRVRGRGLGRRVLHALIEHASDHGGTLVWCHARVGAIDFYGEAGFATLGEVFDDGVALHQSMWRLLPAAAHSSANG